MLAKVAALSPWWAPEEGLWRVALCLDTCLHLLFPTEWERGDYCDWPPTRQTEKYPAKQKRPLFDYCGFDQPERQCSMFWHKTSPLKKNKKLLRASCSWNSMLHCSVHWEMYSNVEEINTPMLKVSVLNYWTWQRKYWISPVLLTQHTALTFCLPRGKGLHYQPAVRVCVWDDQRVCEMMRDGKVTAIQSSRAFILNSEDSGKHFSNFTSQHVFTKCLFPFLLIFYSSKYSNWTLLSHFKANHLK